MTPPLFLIRARGVEFQARAQHHNRAWWEAKDLSFEHGSVELVRVDGDGVRTVAGRFDSGLPVREDAAGVAS